MEQNTSENKYEIISRHYYGHTIRGIFLFVGLVMLVSFPFFSDLTPVPLWISIGIMTLLAIFGGLMNPAQRWLLVVNAIVPTIGFIVFEYQAVFAYLHVAATDPRRATLFWVNQLISLLFFIALYLSIKTVRGRFVKEVE